MRNQTPIQQQRRAQTQLSRSRPHNPSITRRNQPPRQRQSVMRQMQQQTRQRTRRQRKSTPLPEKPGRKRQTTRRRHAHRTHRHMVAPAAIPTNRKGGARRKAGKQEKREEKRRQQEDTMVFGDNVRARRAARALPRTPTQREEEKRKRTGEKTRETCDENYTPITPPPFQPTHKSPPPFHNDTTLPQRHNPKPTMM